MTNLAIRKPIDFNAGFDASVAANAKVWEHDRSKTCGASEVFTCIRCLRFKKLHPDMKDTEVREDNWGHSERGNIMENEFVVPALQDMFGDKALFMGDQQKTLVKGKLSATPDGIVVDQARDSLKYYNIPDIGPTECFSTEVKSFGGEFATPKKSKTVHPDDPTRTHIIYEPKPRHRGQNIVQNGLFRETTNYQPDYGVVIYVNPINLKDIRVGAVPFEQSIYKVAHDRANKVFDESLKLKDLPAEGLLNTDCNYCDFTDACNEVEMSRMPGKVIPLKELNPETQLALEAAARNAARLRKQKKEVEEASKLATRDLQDLLFDAGTTKAGGKGWSASVSQNNGKKSLDKDRIAEEFNIDIDDYQKEGSPYFVVRCKSEDADE